MSHGLIPSQLGASPSGSCWQAVWKLPPAVLFSKQRSPPHFIQATSAQNGSFVYMISCFCQIDKKKIKVFFFFWTGLNYFPFLIYGFFFCIIFYSLRIPLFNSPSIPETCPPTRTPPLADSRSGSLLTPGQRVGSSPPRLLGLPSRLHSLPFSPVLPAQPSCWVATSCSPQSSILCPQSQMSSINETSYCGHLPGCFEVLPLCLKQSARRH